MINQAILVGRLTAKPELRYTEGGTAVANFTLAVERPFKNRQGERETDFIPIVAWRERAEFAANYLDKGRWAGVAGRLQIRSFTTEEGQKRRVSEVVADSVQAVGPRPDSPVQRTAPPPPPGEMPAPRPEPPKQSAGAEATDGEEGEVSVSGDDFDDDPFDDPSLG